MRRFLLASLVAAGCLMALTPSIARSFALYGRVVPLRSDTGVNLWYGNHPGASGTSYTLSAKPVPVLNELPDRLAGKLGAMDELQQNSAFLAEVRSFMAKSPGEARALFAKKFFYFWWFSPHTGLLYPKCWLAVYRLYYAVILILTLAGLWLAFGSKNRRKRKGAILFMFAALSISISQAAFYVEGRHRWQIEPLMIVFAAGAAGNVLHRKTDSIGGLKQG